MLNAKKKKKKNKKNTTRQNKLYLYYYENWILPCLCEQDFVSLH